MDPLCPALPATLPTFLGLSNAIPSATATWSLLRLRTASVAVAKFSDWPASIVLRTIPMTWPRGFNTGAPLEPWEIAAEIWSNLVPLTTRDAEMIPRETVPGSWPNGFEITVTSSPSFMLSLDPQRRLYGGLPDTVSIATSLALSAAATEQRCCWPSLSSMRQPAASSSTCAAVTTNPPVTKKPVPLAISWPFASSA